MRTIWKFEIPIEDNFELPIPMPAEFLAVQSQGERVQAWFVVDDHQETVVKRFLLRGTGHPFPEHAERPSGRKPCQYLGTVQLHGGGLVFHLFEDYR